MAACSAFSFSGSCLQENVFCFEAFTETANAVQGASRKTNLTQSAPCKSQHLLKTPLPVSQTLKNALDDLLLWSTRQESGDISWLPDF